MDRQTIGRILREYATNLAHSAAASECGIGTGTGYLYVDGARFTPEAAVNAFLLDVAHILQLPGAPDSPEQTCAAFRQWAQEVA